MDEDNKQNVYTNEMKKITDYCAQEELHKHALANLVAKIYFIVNQYIKAKENKLKQCQETNEKIKPECIKDDSKVFEDWCIAQINLLIQNFNSATKKPEKIETALYDFAAFLTGDKNGADQLSLIKQKLLDRSYDRELLKKEMNDLLTILHHHSFVAVHLKDMLARLEENKKNKDFQSRLQPLLFTGTFDDFMSLLDLMIKALDQVIQKFPNSMKAESKDKHPVAKNKINILAEYQANLPKDNQLILTYILTAKKRDLDQIVKKIPITKASAVIQALQTDLATIDHPQLSNANLKKRKDEIYTAMQNSRTLRIKNGFKTFAAKLLEFLPTPMRPAFCQHVYDAVLETRAMSKEDYKAIQELRKRKVFKVIQAQDDSSLFNKQGEFKACIKYSDNMVRLALTHEQALRLDRWLKVKNDIYQDPKIEFKSNMEHIIAHKLSSENETFFAESRQRSKTTIENHHQAIKNDCQASKKNHLVR